MRCIDCTEPATHRGRCEVHHGAYEGRPTVRARRVRQAQAAWTYNGAARLRKRIELAGTGRCEWCWQDFPPSAIDVDHIIPLALGGEDTDGNVQALCRPCHKGKTSRDFGAASTPF
ncbi:HNH endonuclease signature motif containing protein [Kitasatospora sp. NPDC002040]|uniref:HNH endonuclease n=1 Tax=Kitasatospora sp. NPDC002040 TaxID=3154661 RepID=UPI00332DED3B